MTLRRTLALTSLLLLAGTLPLHAQLGGGSDTVKYLDRAKGNEEITKLGEVKETAAGATITSSGKSITISPADIVAVYYGTLVGVDDRERQSLPSLDEKGGIEAKKKYDELLQKASASSSPNERTRRFLEFKSAMLAASIADTRTGDEFRTEATAAIAQLLNVARSYNKSWEVWPASRTAARLQAELGNFKEAAQTLSTLAKVEGLPPTLQNNAKLAEVDVLLRTGSPLAAEPVIDAAAKITTLSAVQKQRLAVYQALLNGAKERTDPAKVQAAAKIVHEQIDKMTDPLAKATAHNALGKLFMMADQPRDAMWEFLWVEAVYNSDADEVAKALDRLAELFEKQGDKDRAAIYREKFQKAKGS